MASCCYQPWRHELNNISSPFPRALENKLHPAVRSYIYISWTQAAGRLCHVTVWDPRSDGTVNISRSLFTSLHHEWKVRGICQEYMNVALNIEIYTAFNSKDCPICQRSSLTCYMILLRQQCWPSHWYGHTPLCRVTSFAHNADKHGRKKHLNIYTAYSESK